MAPVKRTATYADIEALPEHQVGEIVDGELFVSPRPASPHAFAYSALGTLLVSRFQWGDGGPGGWWIVDELELHLQGNVVVPDLAGWRKERMPEFPVVANFTMVPDWVCEIISPSTGKLDRARKAPFYARVGVPFVWLVEPDQRTVEVLRLVDGRYVIDAVHSEDEVVRAAPFEAGEIALTRLWIPRP
jgi:Uma2 family endonuclease